MKLYNKAISPMDNKFDGHAKNLAVFLANVRDCTLHFNWHHLFTIPFANRSMKNLLMHYGQVSIDNTHAHATSYIGTQTRNTQDNDMFIILSWTCSPPHSVLNSCYIPIMNRTAATSIMIKQIIILTCIDSRAAAQHVREMLVESKKKLIALKGDISEFNTWVHTQMEVLFRASDNIPHHYPKF